MRMRGNMQTRAEMPLFVAAAPFPRGRLGNVGKMER